MKKKTRLFSEEKIPYNKFFEIFNGWNAYAKWANSYKLVNEMIKKIKLPE